MRVGRLASALTIAGALGTSGCPTVGAFECIDAGDCDRQADGQCIEGACAYPSGACTSGLEWSPNAPTDPGECVDTAGSSTGDTTPSTTSLTTASSSDSTTTSTSEPATTSSGPVPSCGSRMNVEIDTGVLSPTTALVDYPLLFSLTNEDLVDADPETIFFTADDGTPRPHELESFDSATGAILAWVRLPEWTVGEPLMLTLAWGNPASVPDGSAIDVWSSTFVGVWHLGDALDDTEGEVVRNAAGTGHGFAFGGVGADQSVGGAIGGGMLFDGNDDYVEVDAPFVGSFQAFTVSYWSRWDGARGQTGGFFTRLNGEYLMPRCWRVDTGSPFCQLVSDGTTMGVGGSADDIAPGELVHMAFTWDGAVATTYYAGMVGRTNDQYPGTMAGDEYPMQIGREVEFGTFDGMLDEFRVSDHALPPEWISADFRTQSNPGNAILDVGPTEPQPCD